MNHDAMRLADKFATLTAGWMFDAVTLDQFYKSAYQSGWKAGAAVEQARCALVCEQIGAENPAAGLWPHVCAEAICERGG